MIAGPGPFEVLFLILIGGGFGISPGVPQAEDPLMAKVAPAECIYYMTWAGTDKPDADSQNHTEQLLAEPEVQAFLERTEDLVFGGMTFWGMQGITADNPEARETMADMRKLIELVRGRSGTVFVTEVEFAEPGGPPTIQGGGVLRVDQDAETLAKLIQKMQDRAGEAIQVSTVQVAGRPFTRVTVDEEAPPITWGVAGKYFVVGIGDGSAEALIARGRGQQQPAWLQDLRKQLPVPRPSWMVYANVNAIVQLVAEQSDSPEVGQVISALGFENVRNVATVEGLDQTGYVTRSLVTVEGRGKGLLSWIDAPPLTVDDLQVISKDAPTALAFRLNAPELLQGWLDLVRQIEPRAAEDMERDLDLFQEQLDVNIRKDILDSLGDTVRLFAQPGPNGLINGWTLALKVKDRQKLEPAYERLIDVAKLSLEQAPPDAPRLLSSSTDSRTIYTLDFGQQMIPVKPSWTLTDDELFITLSPDRLDALLTANQEAPSITESPEVQMYFREDSRTLGIFYIDMVPVMQQLLPLAQLGMQWLGGQAGAPPFNAANLPPSAVFERHLQPTVIAVQRTDQGVEFDSHQTLPVGNIGASAPVLVALLLPAVSSAREAARRMQSSNNLKQIALAMHNYHDTFKVFPAGYSADEEGKALLSWRVHILPFIDQAALYDRFHLDEPWDSPHNKQLIAEIPETYRSPNSKLPRQEGKTNYLGIGGADGIFVRPQDGEKNGTGFRNITDGSSNTVMVVEVPDESALIWTKPGDLAPKSDDPAKGILGMRPKGFLAAFADGSVQFLQDVIDKDTLNALFTKSGGEVVQLP